ncbi:MAG: DUF2000 domain-containing protein [Desulfosarcinaceae bacterium]
MNQDPQVDPLARDNRIAIILSTELEAGQMANRAAVLATGLAARHPEIVGPPLATADGRTLGGITKVPMAVLAADDPAHVQRLTLKADQLGCTLMVYLARAQGLRSYEAYQRSIAQDRFDELDVDSVILYGPKKRVNKVTGNLALVR